MLIAPEMIDLQLLCGPAARQLLCAGSRCPQDTYRY
jgi:hypothetical protein